MDAKLNTLKETFLNRFTHEQFLRFAIEFFGGIKIISKDRDNTNIPNEYKYTVESYRHLASYSSDGDTLDVFAVKLQSGRGRTVERARSMQRSFISKLLTNAGHDGAIAAFYTDDDPRWRLSFIRLDYELAAGRVKMSLTPAKRYSYLVGENEPCHTAMEQLYPIFREEDYRPTFDRIEEAFSVERVTKDFFEQYKEKYFVLKEYLDGSEVFNEEAEQCGFTSEQFAKKLMGQLAFLYFLQKKGWLGISVLPHKLTEKEYKNAFYANRASREIIPQIYHPVAAGEYKLNLKAVQSLSDNDADIAAGCFKADEWGKGEKKFVRHLFTNCKSRNFFDDYLEPLFYEALNQKRGNNSFYKRFNCKIPFLNGGLFEPLEGYDWQYSRFEIPNELFSNKGEKGERDANGILDIFDRYNFTMNEDEPLEREVAVDPEMLGKIFENLLDAKDRKSKGAFYTPREIVHYMCAESLVNYLVGKTGVPYDALKIFIVDGEFLKDEDYWSTGERKLPQAVFDKLDEIDKALETIRVADPAVGSGAFPLGMLSEIVKARITISYYKAGQIRYPYEEIKKQRSERRQVFERYNPYRLKWDTIQNCIFAVDIDASAVDIAKLRLWLSLVVEEDLTPSEEEQRLGIAERKDPHPLPNLDYNIMCGNSLIDEFEGVQLFDDTLFGKGKYDTSGIQINTQTALFRDNMQMHLDDLRREQERLFGEQTPSVKRDIKKNIDKIIDNIIRAKLERDNNISGLRKYEEVLKQKTKPYFLWKLEFARVFRENGGFDVVIGNPPYGVQFSAEQKSYLAVKWPNVPDYESADYFIDKSKDILKKQGILSYIVPNMFMANLFAEKYRKSLLENWLLQQIDNLSKIDVFDTAKVRNCILFLKNDTGDFSAIFSKLTIKAKTVASVKSKSFSRNKLISFIENWLNLLEQDETSSAIVNKMLMGSKPLREIADISQGLIPYDKYRGHSEETIKNRIWHSARQVNETYKRELAGKDVNRYIVNWNGKTWISYGDWLAAPRKKEYFTSPRIIVREITNPRILASYTSEEYYNTPSIINCIGFTEDVFFVLGVINSKLLSYFHITTSPKAGKGLFPKILVNDVRKLPIKIGAPIIQNNISEIVKVILDMKQSSPTANTSALEAKIDRMVYELYGLTDEEIKIIEESVK